MKPLASKTLLLLTAAAAAFATVSAVVPASADPSVTITIVGIKVREGSVLIALHDEKGWSGAALARTKIAVKGDTIIAVLAAPAPGRYGLKLFHDINGNGELDTNLVGIPTEPFGFSNDAPVRFGPPEFAAAGFDVGASGAVQTITLK
jgi:uncharacterized protein (DUF2141 family)